MKLSETSAFDENLYCNLDIDRLVVYVLFYLEGNSIQLTLENIIVGAFRLFPCKFSLFGFPEYPDSARVEKSLWRSRGKERQWIGGKTRQGYSLNRRSYMIAEHVMKDLEIKSGIKRSSRGNKRLRRWEKIIMEIEKSSAYKKYIDDRTDSITESEFCYVLQGTLDSPKEILNENLLTLKTMAKDLDNQEIERFLYILESKFSKF